MPEERIPHAFGFCQFSMIPIFHGTEITKEVVQYRSEELFVSYSKRCDMNPLVLFSMHCMDFDSVCATSFGSLYFVVGTYTPASFEQLTR
jgi:hypothetical protein